MPYGGYEIYLLYIVLVTTFFNILPILFFCILFKRLNHRRNSFCKLARIWNNITSYGGNHLHHALLSFAILANDDLAAYLRVPIILF